MYIHISAILLRRTSFCTFPSEILFPLLRQICEVNLFVCVHAFQIFINHNIVFLHVIEHSTFLIRTASLVFSFVLEERVSELIYVLDTWKELIDQAETHIHVVNCKRVEKIWECPKTNILRENYNKFATGNRNTLY